MRKLLLAFAVAGLLFAHNTANAQALRVSPADTLTFAAPLDSLTQVYPDVIGYVVNNSGQPDTGCWKLLSARIDSQWLEISCCDPVNCYYFSSGGLHYNTHQFPADTGVFNRLEFNSTPSCVADSGELQILIWLQHDSAASATVITYKSLFTGACVTSAITKVPGNEIRIYPTPVSTQLTIEGLDNLNNAGIYIYDMLGNVVLHKTVSDPQNTQNINTTSLQAGVYIVGIDSNGARVLTRRIEKME